MAEECTRQDAWRFTLVINRSITNMRKSCMLQLPRVLNDNWPLDPL